MANKKSTPITASIATILPREEIETLARELGVVTRQRKVQVFALVTVLTMAYRSGTTRTIAAMRETYEKLTNTPLTRNAFYKRGDRRRSLAESGSDSAVHEGFGGIVAQVGDAGAGAKSHRWPKHRRGSPVAVPGLGDCGLDVEIRVANFFGSSLCELHGSAAERPSLQDVLSLLDESYEGGGEVAHGVRRGLCEAVTGEVDRGAGE